MLAAPQTKTREPSDAPRQPNQTRRSSANARRGRSRGMPGHWEAGLMLFADAARRCWGLTKRQTRFQHRSAPLDRKVSSRRNIARQFGQNSPQAIRKTISFDNGARVRRDTGFTKNLESKPSSAIPIVLQKKRRENSTGAYAAAPRKN